jgi:hypothetical protein
MLSSNFTEQDFSSAHAYEECKNLFLMNSNIFAYGDGIDH